MAQHDTEQDTDSGHYTNIKMSTRLDQEEAQSDRLTSVSSIPEEDQEPEQSRDVEQASANTNNSNTVSYGMFSASTQSGQTQKAAKSPDQQQVRRIVQ